MNLEQSAAIRVAINDTLNQLRPPVMGNGIPEPTRTALQAHLDALLKEELRALIGQALVADFTEKLNGYIDPRKDPAPPIYENLWLQATSDLNAAMDLVQQNQDFFGAQCGDDKIKVIGEFFVKWAAVMIKPEAANAPWYPDDSGKWVEVPNGCTTCPCTPSASIEILVRGERHRQDFRSSPRVASVCLWDNDVGSACRIVAYKVVKP